MDPNLFHIDYERLFEVMVTIAILSILVERFLSVLFESRPFIEKTKDSKWAFKEIISFIVAVGVCIFWQLDAISILIVNSDQMTVPGMIITGGVVAGGAKGSVKLFKDVFGFMSRAEKQRLIQPEPEV